jgi:pantetheine-phosphate adenylyltransferase
LFPGTFDPITLGHLDLIQRSATMFESVTVLVAGHPSKQHLFGVEQRLELVRGACEGLEQVTVAATTGLLVDACREHGTNVVVRGLRGPGDLEYEVQMANTNRAMSPGMDTIFLAAAPEHGHLSSTLVRQIASMGGDVSGFVPANVLHALKDHF